MVKRLLNINPFIVINPIPFIPFPLLRGRGGFVFRGALAPLKLPINIFWGFASLCPSLKKFAFLHIQSYPHYNAYEGSLKG